jgi:cytochrome c-type biogenesis protein CcmE
VRPNGSPARLVIALSVATTLAVFLLYTSLAGGAIPSVQPSQLASHSGTVFLSGLVLGPIRGDSEREGMRFTLRDIQGAARVRVVYRGAIPDLFRRGRHVFVRGHLRGGVFLADPGSLVTKCPSKYTAKPGS